MKAKVTDTIITTLFITLFTYAAISKIIDYHNFYSQLAISPLLAPLARLFTWLIPAAELYTVILLMDENWRRSGFLLCSILMLAFTAYIAAMLLFFEQIPCSCGGVFEQLNWHEHLILNTVFSTLAIAGYRNRKKDFLAMKQENAENLKQSKHP